MEGPAPPRDIGLHNIIDKLAEFVARNGPEFEAITKQKQAGNPKFEFLYGGEFYNYYLHRVATEQAFLKQQQQQQEQIQQQHDLMQSQQQQQSQQNQINSNNMHQQQHQMAYHQSAIVGMNAQSLVQQQQQQQHQQQQQQQLQQHWNNNPNINSTASNITAQIETINMQQMTLRDQIRQSEQNLTAQHTALRQHQQKQIEEAITTAENEKLRKQAEENNIDLSEFNGILQPIIESCTKDSISAGKNWILQHTSDTAKCNVVLQYLLKKALLNGSTFTQKLHLIYLVNDVLHHCVRKNANDLKSSLENVVIPMFCSTDIIANEEQRKKLSKLLSLWESKAKFFDACVISKLQSPESSMQEYKTNLMNIHNDLVSNCTQATISTLENYQQQHQIFIQHATKQIAALESQKQSIEQQILSKVLPNANLLPQLASLPSQLAVTSSPVTAVVSHMQSMNTNSTNQMMNNHQQHKPQQQPPMPMPMPMINQQLSITASQPIDNSFGAFIESKQKQSNSNVKYDPFNNMNALHSPQQNSSGLYDCLSSPNSLSNKQYQQQQQQQQPPQSDQQQIPILCGYPQSLVSASKGPIQNSNEMYSGPSLNFFIPDFSKPPPGFNTPLDSNGETIQISEEGIKPELAYYSLPAGLMVPLIRLEDFNYKPLDPEDLRLPPPAPPSERLTNALAAFYSLPSHDRPRDNEGWEKLGLYEYYKVKNAARKQKEEEIKNGLREKSRSPSPIIIEAPVPRKGNRKRVYRSKSPSRSRSKSPPPALPPLPPKARSRTPPLLESKSSRSRNSSNRSRSPKKNSSSRTRDRERERNERRERERERDNRSVSPPSFFGANYVKPNEFIEESNKGHQMLMKMGWAGSGTGLGSKNQGIDSPIDGGEVRDRKDMYKGVGVSLNDPFENFRKNKGAAFIHRMRSRAEENS